MQFTNAISIDEPNSDLEEGGGVLILEEKGEVGSVLVEARLCESLNEFSSDTNFGGKI